MIKRLSTLLLTIAAAAFLVAPVQQATALSGSEFQAGRIIDDAKFFAASPMSLNDIQAFLNAKVPACDTWHARSGSANDPGPPYTCLKNYQTVTTAKSAESGICNGMQHSGATAAEVILWVAESCGINPQVLIVLLQKEQSLITDTWPWPIQYRSATGYGCPDTAPCDSEYYGFFNQVYMAARQFKRMPLFKTTTVEWQMLISQNKNQNGGAEAPPYIYKISYSRAL